MIIDVAVVAALHIAGGPRRRASPCAHTQTHNQYVCVYIYVYIDMALDTDINKHARAATGLGSSVSKVYVVRFRTTMEHSD